MRRLAALALAGAILVPVSVAAQSPSPVPFGELSLCVTAQVQNGVALEPDAFTLAVTEGRALISSVVLCDPPAAPVPTNGPEPEPTEAPTAYEQLNKRSWQRILKAPDDYIGDEVRVWACITQFDSSTGSDTFRGDAFYKKLPADDYWTDGENAIFTSLIADLSDFVEDDVVSMQATVAGSYSYETTMGGEITVPMFWVDTIRRRGSC